MIKIVLVALIFAATANARALRMSRGSSCMCRHNIQKERDNAVKKHNEIADDFDKLTEFVTMTNCEPGSSFNYENSKFDIHNVVCNKCPENYYRAANNGTCLHCPEGYITKEGSSQCKRASENDIIHSLCPIGSVVGKNPFAKHRNSCVKCDKKFREYMPYLNNKDGCMICPMGSIINYDSECKKCPVGYYEKNNKCVECDVGTFNNIEGSEICKVCNNNKATAYYSIGGTNCEDSALFEVANKLNDYINVDTISKPVINGMQIGGALIYNNRKIIQELSAIGSFLGIMTAMVMSG